MFQEIFKPKIFKEISKLKNNPRNIQAKKYYMPFGPFKI